MSLSGKKRKGLFGIVYDTFFLFGEMRSGNHFLIDLLRGTGKIRIRTRYDVTNESYTEIDIDKIKATKTW